MINRKIKLKGLLCSDCRLKVLSTFFRINALSSTPITATSFSKSAVGYRPFTRQLQQWGRFRSDHIESLSARHTEITESQNSQQPEESENSNDAPLQEDSTPWYLDVEPPDHETAKSLLQRQRMPELPSDPPPLLRPMLEQIFVELGIDDLMLFDLRRLDPPPALGANLIMIIGTARSEKHLHVSADLFCRYMKNNHRITPFADGLLGRGELKLKLKRKARRARILGRVGSTESSNTDDGIRTGWICVTVSNIEDGRAIKEDAGRLPDDHVGFGEEEHGANVVIQMLTQEKREELDLEDLWGKTLQRHERKQDRISRGIEETDVQDEVGSTQLHVEKETADFLPNLSSSLPIRPIAITNDRSHPHAAARHGIRRFSMQHGKYHENVTIPEPNPANLTSRLEATEGMESSVADEFIAAVPLQYEEELRNTGKASAEIFRLKAHLNFAYSLPLEDIRSILGRGAQDSNSTPFLRSFHAALPPNPTAEHWAIRLSLLTLGITVNAPNYTKESLAHLFQSVQSSLATVPPFLYEETISTLLQPNPSTNPADPPHLSQSDIHSAISILDDMVSHGHPLPPISPSNTDVLSLLFFSPIYTDHEPSPHLLTHLQSLLPNPPPLSLQIAKLHACTPYRNFKAMWAIWHSFPALMQPRPPELYAAMMGAVAGTQHAGRCGVLLREVVTSMGREEPRVGLGDVVDDVMGCLRVVAPHLEKRAGEFIEEDGESDARGAHRGWGEWERLWSECERVKLEAGRWAREMDDD